MKYVFPTLLLILLGVASHVHAADTSYVPLVGIPGLTDIPIDNGQLPVFFNRLYVYLVGISTVAAVIMIIWGGFEYATKDSIVAKGDGKTRIQEALFGLTLVLSPVLVFSIINPNILNLSLGIPPLVISKPAGSAGAGGGGGAGPSGPETKTETAGGVSVQIIQSGSLLKTIFVRSNDETANNNKVDELVSACRDRGGNALLTQKSQCSSRNQDATKTCATASDAQMFCIEKTSDTFKYVNVGNVLGSNLWPTPQGQSEVSSYANTCSSNGGSVCFAQGGVKPRGKCDEKIPPLPSERFLGFELSANGECYDVQFRCIPKNQSATVSLGCDDRSRKIILNSSWP